MNLFHVKENSQQHQQSSSLNHRSSVIQLHQSRISLVALSQHKGVTVASELPTLQKSRHSCIALDLNKQFQSGFQAQETGAAGSKKDLTAPAYAVTGRGAYAADGHELYASSNSFGTLGISPSIDDGNFNLSSFVGPSVYQLIPELQRGESAYSFPRSDSSFSDRSIGDIDYFWSVIPSVESVRTEVKAAILDTYSADNNLPTILQPRFKPKAPGTAIALWLPTLMASLAKRLTDENPSDLTPTLGGNKYKDIVKQNMCDVLKRDFDAVNWLFKRNTGKQSQDSMRDQQQQRRRDIRVATTRTKHLQRGDGAAGGNNIGGEVRTCYDSEQDTDTIMEYRKQRIKYVEHETSNDAQLKLKAYDNSPVTSRRKAIRGSSVELDSNSERSSSAEPGIVNPDHYGPVFDDDDVEDLMIFFNYSDDGASFSCTKSPIHTPRMQTLSNSNSLRNASTCSDNNDCSISSPGFENARHLSDPRSVNSDSEDEEELFAESFQTDTEHINCECIKYSRVDASTDYGDFHCLRALDDNTQQDVNMINMTTVVDCEPKVKTKSKPKRKIPRSRQRRITDTGRKPRNSHEDKAVDIDEQDKDAKRGKHSENDMWDKLEYMMIASNEKADICVRLLIRMPQLLHLCNIQTHLLLCTMRAFFTCTEGIYVQWLKTLQDKIYQLLQRKDTSVKFSDHDDDSQNRVACLVLSHDASVLLRDRRSSLLTSIADILQVDTDNVIVLEQAKSVVPVPPPRRKSRIKKKSSVSMKSTDSDYRDCDMGAIWHLPLML